MLTGRPEHLKTFDYLGVYRYFLTFCTYQRHHGFTDAERVDLVRSQILRVSIEQQFALIAYCFMPDHVHLLVEGQTAQADCRRFIARAKQFSAFYYRKAFGERLWQRFGYEHVLRREEETLSVARYILENPVRGGVVQTADAYPFIGSSVHTVTEILEAIQMANSAYGRRSG